MNPTVGAPLIRSDNLIAPGREGGQPPSDSLTLSSMTTVEYLKNVFFILYVFDPFSFFWKVVLK